MASIITTRAASCRSLKYSLNKLVFITNLDEIKLRSLIRDNFVEQNDDISFDADTPVRSVKGKGRDAASLLDQPMIIVLFTLNWDVTKKDNIRATVCYVFCIVV